MTAELDNVTETGIESFKIKDRQMWMGVLARGALPILEKVWADFPNKPKYNFLRSPELGMAMVRARAGGEGARFNLGEMTITRCVVRTEDGYMGQSYVAGRNLRHAELCAVFDALLQNATHRMELQNQLIAPLQLEMNKKRKDTAKKVATTRVDFFTMVRGED